eukprot:12462129-Ditylum_brightwellii.AAC.1
MEALAVLSFYWFCSGGRGGVFVGGIGGDGAAIGFFVTIIRAIATASKSLCVGRIIIFFGRGGAFIGRIPKRSGDSVTE